MGWETFHFGQIYQDGIPQHVPTNPIVSGDFPTYFPSSNISILKDKGDAITWVKPNGMNVFVADRVLVRAITWNDLNTQGFADGKEIVMNGWRFLCRMPRTVTNPGGDNEWDAILNATVKEDWLWHWKAMLFWESGIPSSMSKSRLKRKPIRGALSAQHTDELAPSDEDIGIGFRPVLEPMGTKSPIPNCTLEGQAFQLNFMCDGTKYLPMLQPTKENIFANISDGQRVHMYTLLKDGKPVLMNTHQKTIIKSKHQLELTDHYYGNEYLVPWTISNGIAISDRSLLKAKAV